jgi:predicted TIM-barrel fold metal-dependent hydrolase
VTEAQAPTTDGAAASGAPERWDCHLHVFEAAAAVRPGHYPPQERPLSAVQAEASALGITRLVLVQPSVYGSDHGVLLRALAQQPGRHRAVAVLDNDVDDATLAQLHAAGVRGARLNLVSPVGEGAGGPATAAPTIAQRFEALAPRLLACGWHLQWYAHPEWLPHIAALHRTQPQLTGVLDHLAGLHAEVADDDPVWSSLRALAEGGAWIKISALYRLRSPAPYAGLHARVQRVAELFGERMVWGSDWPHTGIAPAQLPAYGDTWAPAAAALGAGRAQRLLAAGARLYR